MSRVAQAYIHSARFPREETVERWGKIAESLSYEIAREVFPANAEIEILLEPGSLKTRAKVTMAALLAAYGAIATYPDFKAGLVEATRDAREFAGAFNENFQKFAGISNEDVVRKERRTETPGRLTRALDDLEAFERRLPGLTTDEIEGELQTVVHRLQLGLSGLGLVEREQAFELISEQHVHACPGR